MRNITLIVALLLLIVKSQAQAPGIQWQNSIGGNAIDLPFAIRLAQDGGYFIGGCSNSDASIDKHEKCKGSMALYDYWVVRCDVAGNILWENTIGGKRDDWNTCICPTSDNGCVVGGFSSSPAGGDKTEAAIGVFSEPDFWILKLDNAGHIVWQNTIGSTSLDFMLDICVTPDGGYLLFGESYGDLDGDKTSPHYGNYDYWLVKVNSVGDIVWQKSYGGSGVDHAVNITPAVGGGYYLLGQSYSNISGTKLENSRGGADFWIIKVDEEGNEIWQKTIGSSSDDAVSSISAVSDGGAVICGNSSGTISGEKTISGYGEADIWVIKLDSDGAITWQNVIGGNLDDISAEIVETGTGHLRIASNSVSPVSGNKTVASVTYSDFWIIQLTSNGTIEWQQNVSGNHYDYMAGMTINENDETVMLGFGYSGYGNDKNEPNYAGYDYWLVALADTCAAETCNDIDDNCDGLIDNDFTDSLFVVVNGPLEFCSPGSVHFTAYYTGNTIQWKRNGNPIAGAVSSSYYATKSGSYTATTTSDCGTYTSAAIVVTENTLPNATISASGATTFCPGGSVVLNVAPVAGATYQWYKGPTALAGAIGVSYTVTTSGNYKCNVTKTATGCTKTSNTIAVSATCRLEDVDMPELQIYPNPASNMITINNNAGPLGHVFIMNALGMRIYYQFTEADSIEINISNLPSGVYWLKVGEEAMKFVKE